MPNASQRPCSGTSGLYSLSLGSTCTTSLCNASVTTQTNVGICRHILLITLELVHQLAGDEAEIQRQTDHSCCSVSQQFMVASETWVIITHLASTTHFLLKKSVFPLFKCNLNLIHTARECLCSSGDQLHWIKAIYDFTSIIKKTKQL